jgi:hypothetical protein
MLHRKFMAAMSVDLDAVRSTAREVRAAFLDMPDEPYRGAKAIFPQIWCEWASIALAEVLAARGLGEWTFVEMKLHDSLSGHSWLELRAEDGRTMFTVDITLDQFEEWNDWYMGVDSTPALSKFGQLIFAGPWREWPPVKTNHTFAGYAEKVVRYLEH